MVLLKKNLGCVLQDRDVYCETITTSPSEEALNNISEATRAHHWEESHKLGKTRCHLEPVMLTGKLEGTLISICCYQRKETCHRVKDDADEKKTGSLNVSDNGRKIFRYMDALYRSPIAISTRQYLYMSDTLSHTHS